MKGEEAWWQEKKVEIYNINKQRKSWQHPARKRVVRYVAVYMTIAQYNNKISTPPHAASGNSIFGDVARFAARAK